MYGNTSFDVARESNIDLPDCLSLQYAFQAVIDPETHDVLSQIYNPATNTCNQVQLCFAQDLGTLWEAVRYDGSESTDPKYQFQ
jgi:hypothetical protein